MEPFRVGLMLIMLGGMAVPAAAADKAAARQAYAEGTKYYDLNQHAEALEAFKRAYWNYEEPAFLFNIAQCHRALGHKTEALAFYRSYLRRSVDPSNRDEVQKIITGLESAIVQEKTLSAAPPQGTIAADGRPRAAQPSPTLVASPAVPMPAPARSEKPTRKRAWVWGVVAGAVAAGVAVGVGVGVGMQPHPPKVLDGEVNF